MAVTGTTRIWYLPGHGPAHVAEISIIGIMHAQKQCPFVVRARVRRTGKERK